MLRPCCGCRKPPWLLCKPRGRAGSEHHKATGRPSPLRAPHLNQSHRHAQQADGGQYGVRLQPPLRPTVLFSPSPPNRPCPGLCPEGWTGTAPPSGSPRQRSSPCLGMTQESWTGTAPHRCSHMLFLPPFRLSVPTSPCSQPLQKGWTGTAPQLGTRRGRMGVVRGSRVAGSNLLQASHGKCLIRQVWAPARPKTCLIRLCQTQGCHIRQVLDTVS